MSSSSTGLSRGRLVDACAPAIPQRWGAAISDQLLQADGRASPRNPFLRALPPDDLGRMRPALARVKLPFKEMICEEGKPAEFAYFIESGIISMLARVEDGHLSEVGLVGREGFVGIALLLGGMLAPTDAMVQMEATAFRMD